MNRRSFLQLATTAAIGAMVLDPERLLWTPGQRTYFDIRRPNLQVGDWVYLTGKPSRTWRAPDGSVVIAAPAHSLRSYGNQDRSVTIGVVADPRPREPLVLVQGPATVLWYSVEDTMQS